MRSAVPDHQRDLARFYDQQSAERLARPVPADGAAFRTAFAEALLQEGRRRVLDLGCGPGHDAVSLGQTGFSVTGVDLSAEHVRICRDRDVAACVASLFALPFPEATFDAGWTMSVLLHVPNTQIDEALTEILRVLRPGAPLAVGTWTDDTSSEQHVWQDGIDVPRFFSIRSAEAFAEILAPYGRIELDDVHRRHPGQAGWYQRIVLRKPGVAEAAP